LAHAGAGEVAGPAAKVVAPTHGWIAASTIAASLADCQAR
jgi:hypothetical protein